METYLLLRKVSDNLSDLTVLQKGLVSLAILTQNIQIQIGPLLQILSTVMWYEEARLLHNPSLETVGKLAASRDQQGDCESVYEEPDWQCMDSARLSMYPCNTPTRLQHLTPEWSVISVGWGLNKD